MLLHYIYLACLLLSCVVSFVYLKELRSRQLSFFPYYLSLVLVQELFVFLYVNAHPDFSTGFIYNIYNPVTAVFFAAFYHGIPFNYPSRGLIRVLTIIFLTATAVTYLFIQPLSIYNNYISLGAGFLITLCGLLFLFNYFKLDNAKEEKKWLPVIWITIGLIAFFPVVNISFALYKHLLAYQATILGLKLYRLIPQLMSIFMYSCFIWAFYLCKKKK